MNNINDINDFNRWAKVNSPKTVSGINNLSYQYYAQTLFTKLKSIFEFEGLPEEWDSDYFLDILYTFGYIAVVRVPRGKTLGGSVLALQNSFSGINIYNKPTDVIIANPIIGSFTAKIGRTAEVVFFNNLGHTNFQSPYTIVQRYATLLAECDATLNTTLINSRVAHIFTARNKAEEESYKKMYDDITAGVPAIFVRRPSDDDLSVTRDVLNVKNVYIGNDITITKRTILNEFYSEIGIVNANVDKKERLTTDEVNVKQDEVSSMVDTWLTNLEKSLNRINKLFSLNISVKKRYEQKGVTDNGDNMVQPISNVRE